VWGVPGGTPTAPRYAGTSLPGSRRRGLAVGTSAPPATWVPTPSTLAGAHRMHPDSVVHEVGSQSYGATPREIPGRVKKLERVDHVGCVGDTNGSDRTVREQVRIVRLVHLLAQVEGQDLPRGRRTQGPRGFGHSSAEHAPGDARDEVRQLTRLPVHELSYT